MRQENKDKLKGAMDQVKHNGQTLVDKAVETKDEAKVEVKKQAEIQKDAVTSQVRDVDQALRQTAQSVDNPALERQIVGLANQVERVASTLESAEIDDMIVSVEKFSRTNPVLFMTGSFAIGLMAARFLRATSHESSLPASRRYLNN